MRGGGARRRSGEPFDEVYQLAADMGGMGFIHSAECEIMRNSCLVNLNMTHAAANAGVKRYLFSSSACVYRDMTADEPELSEARPTRRTRTTSTAGRSSTPSAPPPAYGRRFGMVVRLARFQNCYGPEGTWRGGREKAPAAMCRKIAGIEDGGTVEVWGDGTAMRAYTFVDDMVDGIVTLMKSDLEGGVNIGRREYVSVDELARLVAEVAGKRIRIEHVDGPVGVKARNFVCERIEAIGWRSKVSLREGLSRTYPWIRAQVEAARAVGV